MKEFGEEGTRSVKEKEGGRHGRLGGGEEVGGGEEWIGGRWGTQQVGQPHPTTYPEIPHPYLAPTLIPCPPTSYPVLSWRQPNF